MSRAILLPIGGDVVAAVANALLSERESLDRCLAVFPGKRPSHFVYRALARKIGKPFRAPQVLSLDDLTAKWFSELKPGASGNAGAADGVAMLYQLHQTRGLPAVAGAPEAKLELDEFLPWGLKLFSDFEELRIEGVAPEALRSVQAAADEKLPERMRQRLADLSGLYEQFYAGLAAEKLSTRAGRYAGVAAAADDIPLDEYKAIVLAGFFALTASEKRIFTRLLSDDRTTLILQDGPGIGGLIAALGIKPERSDEKLLEPQYHFIKAVDAHGEAMALARSLSRTDGPKDLAIVLPSAETLFPVIEAALPDYGDDWNISMGFPLARTPAFALLDRLAAAQNSRDGELYYAPDYLKMLLHPYVKNIMLARSGQLARILAHTIEERLNDRQQRYLRPSEIERDPEIISEFLKRAAGSEALPAAEHVTEHLSLLHGLLLQPFERPERIGGFALSVMNAVSHISRHSPANRHPYAPAFIEAMIRALQELAGSRLAREKFSSAAGYFRLIRGALSRETVPFDGTPLKRLQVLGFLETRNIRFDAVHILDCNEGVLPRGRKPDSILPQAVRKELGLPSPRQGDDIVRYYFENLIAGASEAHLYYREGADREKSRLIERLLWREQEKAGSLDVPAPMPVFFESSFAQRDPEPVAKSPAMVSFLRGLAYSSSKLDAYLKCPLAFHHRYVLGLEERAAALGEVDQRGIGTMAHEILEEFFQSKR
ncbi:MAG: PD-(D/E)XK nuclease family protein, partial [Candidatus Edwardsbacteria bacterium]|nr:PD-(D/E)XK nuclease family protein [Candidatus Edwardsbacteria bacterium]